MSMEFSRRSFLKYSALTAVAVAGSGLLSGCELFGTNQPVGKAGDTLSLEGAHKLENPVYTPLTSTLTCDLTIKCTSKNGLSLRPERFEVVVTSADGKTTTTYNPLGTKNNAVKLTQAYGVINKGETKTSQLVVEGITIQKDDTVAVKFWPRNFATVTGDPYQDIYATWVLQNTAKKIDTITTV